MPADSIPPVSLVGAGPGDPELITLKAQRRLAAADVVIYDRLVSEGILDLVPPGVMRIYVGKQPGLHAASQAEINALMARLALSGRKVVRLKGGDPFVFGRGSEEMAYLAEQGVACEVVPGVTAAAGCAARLGVPLTHRRLATGVRFVTGHRCDGEALELNWASLADPDTTLVVYMGLASLPLFAERLVAAGLSPETPAAAIASGTTPEEAACCAPLAALAQRVGALGLKPPILIVIGRVVELAALWQARVAAPERCEHA